MRQGSNTGFDSMRQGSNTGFDSMRQGSNTGFDSTRQHGTGGYDGESQGHQRTQNGQQQGKYDGAAGQPSGHPQQPDGARNEWQGSGQGFTSNGGNRGSGDGDQDGNGLCPVCRNIPPPTGCYRCGRKPPTSEPPSGGLCPVCRGNPPPNGCHHCHQKPPTGTPGPQQPPIFCPVCNNAPPPQGCQFCKRPGQTRNQPPCTECRGNPPTTGCLTCGKAGVPNCLYCRDQPLLTGCIWCNKPRMSPPNNAGATPPGPTEQPKNQEQPGSTSIPTASEYSTPSSASSTTNTTTAPTQTRHKSGVPSLMPLEDSAIDDDFGDMDLSGIRFIPPAQMELRNRLRFAKGERQDAYMQWILNRSHADTYTDGAPAYLLEHIRQLHVKIVRRDATIKEIRQQLENIQASQSKYKVTLEIPEDTRIDQYIDREQLRLAIPDYNPDSEHKVSFKEYYNRFLHYVKEQGYSHSNGKECLRSTLKGTAFEFFCNMQNKPLSYVITQLQKRFYVRKTINDYTSQMDAFRRKAGEPIQSCISRYTDLLTLTEVQIPIHKREGRKEILIDQLLINVSSPKALDKLKEAKAQAQREGYPLTTETMCTIVEDAEDTYQDIPMHEIPSIMTISQVRIPGRLGPSTKTHSFSPSASPRARSLSRPQSPSSYSTSTTTNLAERLQRHQDQYVGGETRAKRPHYNDQPTPPRGTSPAPATQAPVNKTPATAPVPQPQPPSQPQAQPPQEQQRQSRPQKKRGAYPYQGPGRTDHTDNPASLHNQQIMQHQKDLLVQQQQQQIREMMQKDALQQIQMQTMINQAQQPRPPIQSYQSTSQYPPYQRPSSRERYSSYNTQPVDNYHQQYQRSRSQENRANQAAAYQTPDRPPTTASNYPATAHSTFPPSNTGQQSNEWRPRSSSRNRSQWTDPNQRNSQPSIMEMYQTLMNAGMIPNPVANLFPQGPIYQEFLTMQANAAANRNTPAGSQLMEIKNETRPVESQQLRLTHQTDGEHQPGGNNDQNTSYYNNSFRGRGGRGGRGNYRGPMNERRCYTCGGPNDHTFKTCTKTRQPNLTGANSTPIEPRVYRGPGPVPPHWDEPGRCNWCDRLDKHDYIECRTTYNAKYTDTATENQRA